MIESGWGGVRADEIAAVLRSTANALLEQFHGRRLSDIVVRQSYDYPVVTYDRGARGEYHVYLTARGARWGQYVYQFAHELTHILTNFEHRQAAAIANHSQWFEETLCEVASLWTLRALSARWETSPPLPALQGHAAALSSYAKELLSQQHRLLPPGTTPAQFMRINEGALRNDPYLRSQNEMVAKLLLPMFEEDPRLWEAVGYLNLEDKGRDFTDYLHRWYINAPDTYKDVIRHITVLLGVRPL